MNESGRLTCPGCGSDGAFDGQGDKTEITRKVRVDGKSGQQESKVVREWKQFQCTECGCTFRVLDNETEEKESWRVIA